MQTNETSLYGLVLCCRRSQKRKKKSKDRGGESCPLPYHMEGNMKEVKIVIDGKEYIKDRFTGEDWLRMLDYIEAAGDKPLAKEFFDARYDAVSDMMNIPKDKLLKAKLEEVTEVFKMIEKEITQAFFGIPAEKEVPVTQEKAS